MVALLLGLLVPDTRTDYDGRYCIFQEWFAERNLACDGMPMIMYTPFGFIRRLLSEYVWRVELLYYLVQYNRYNGTITRCWLKRLLAWMRDFVIEAGAMRQSKGWAPEDRTAFFRAKCYGGFIILLPATAVRWRGCYVDTPLNAFWP